MEIIFSMSNGFVNNTYSALFIEKNTTTSIHMHGKSRLWLPLSYLLDGCCCTMAAGRHLIRVFILFFTIINLKPCLKGKLFIASLMQLFFL